MKQATVFWFTGLSGAGKSTVAQGIKPLLQKEGFKILILDGDEIRRKMNITQDFSEGGIKKHNAAIIQLCVKERLGWDAIFVSIICPFAQTRTQARAVLAEDFYEIYFSADLETVMRRDPKGLYAKAKANEIKNMVGFSPGAVYEPPAQPDFVLNSAVETAEQSIQRFYCFVLGALNQTHV